MKKYIKRWRVKKLLSRIQKADSEQLECVLHCVLHSYTRVYPETEVIYLALPKKDWVERGRILEAVCNVLMKQKTDSLG